MSLIGKRVRTVSGASALIVDVNKDGLLIDLGNKLPLLLAPEMIFKSLVFDDEVKNMIIKAFPHRMCIRRMKDKNERD